MCMCCVFLSRCMSLYESALYHYILPELLTSQRRPVRSDASAACGAVFLLKEMRMKVRSLCP